MLPVAGKPCVQWIVEELSAAGIQDIIFVTSKGQDMVQEYFAKKTWYEEELLRRGKMKEAQELETIRNLATFHFVEQDRQMGDGHAILQAKKLIPSDEPFLVIFGDCLYKNDKVIQKLQQAHKEKKSCVIAVQQIPSKEAKNYGIAEISNGTITSLIEKPSLEAMSRACRGAPFAIIGRYLLAPSIWKHLEKKHSESGEVRLIDALQSLLKEEEITAVEMKGQWLDTGTLGGIKKAEKYLSSDKIS